MKLETERLILREWRNSDKRDLIEGINNLNVTKWLLEVPYPYRDKDAIWWINHCKKNLKKKNRTDYKMAVELKSEKKLIGGFSLGKVDKFQKTGTLSYWLNEKYHQQGYGSEALEKLISFGFNKLKLRRLNASVFKGNHSSSKLLEKFGAKKEGLKRKAMICKADRKIKDDIIYGLLKGDWLRKKLK